VHIHFKNDILKRRTESRKGSETINRPLTFTLCCAPYKETLKGKHFQISFLGAVNYYS